MKKSIAILSMSLLFYLTGCQSHYLSVCKIPFNKDSLASTYAETPDPKALHPIKGEKVYVTWTIPFSQEIQDARICLKVIYRDLSMEEEVYPITSRIGGVSFAVIDEKFDKTGGVYSYHADLIDQKGRIIDTYQQRMWVNVIKFHSALQSTES